MRHQAKEAISRRTKVKEHMAYFKVFVNGFGIFMSSALIVMMYQIISEISIDVQTVMHLSRH